MQIIVDTREHKSEWERIQKQFDKQGVRYFRSKLYCGDYQNLDNARLVIDRKKDLQEIYGNVCAQHERFKAELLRAIEQGIKIIILCEHGPDVTCLEDVIFFEQPEIERVRWITNKNGKKVMDRYVQREIKGETLYKSLCTIRDRYNVDFVFCTKEETGSKIIELLGG